MSDIYDLETDSAQIILKNDKFYIVKMTKYLNPGQKLKTNINLLLAYNYILFKTKFDNLYYDDTLIFNNLLIDTSTFTYNLETTKKQNIKVEHKINEINEITTYYEQKIKLEIFLIKKLFIEDMLFEIKFRKFNLINTYNSDYCFIKHIYSTKLIDKKYINVMDNNNKFLISYKVEALIKNQYNLYLYKIKNTLSDEELIININYDDVINLLNNIQSYINKLENFIDSTLIIDDNMIFKNMFNITHIKYNIFSKMRYQSVFV